MDECQEAVGRLDQDDCEAARVGLWRCKSVKVTMVMNQKSGYRGWDKSMMNKGVIHETTGWPIHELKPQWLRVWYIEMKGKIYILSTRGTATHDADFEEGRGEDNYEVKEMKA